MKYLGTPFNLGADSGEDAAESQQALSASLHAAEHRLEQLPPTDCAGRAERQLDVSAALLRMAQDEDAWHRARNAFNVFAKHAQWESAVRACEILCRTDRPQALSALGNGVWLAVTYPIDPELSVAMLQHIVEQTPDDADGAAVAAATAAYLVDLRADGTVHESLSIFAAQLLGSVARRHSGITNQADFERWMQALELNDSERFLPRLRNVIDVLVQDDWWIDRDALRNGLPLD
ncbi:MAG: hypothetical protein OEQ39_24695 [Gammaproteobacteria bacterium]|nr:hypothetical protein [Gammaproteobacteria bacterium]MDH3465719.1 hypothetical protein [Gammaproteobacteria bacterium]